MDEELQELLEEYKQKTSDLLIGVNQLKPKPEVLPAVPLEILFYINYLLNGAGGTGSGDASSAANQLTEIARLEQIRDRLSSSADDVIFAKLVEILAGISTLATQATLLAINTKIPASPAQDRTSAIAPSATRLTDGANFYKPTTPSDTQPISAASLPLPVGAATESMLQQVRDAIKAQIDIASTLWTDNSGAFYVRRDLVNEGTGAITVTFTLPDGTAATPGAGLRPLSTVDKDVISDYYDVITNGTGYSVGDLLARIAIIDANGATPTSTFFWINLTTGTILGTAPNSAHIERANEVVSSRQSGAWTVSVSNFPSTQPISAASLPLPTGAATQATLATLLSEGTPATGVTGPTGGGGAFKWLSGIWQLISDRLPALLADSIPIVLRDSTGNELATFDLDNTGGASPVLGVTLRQLSNGSPVEIGSEANPLTANAIAVTTSSYYNDPSNYIDGTAQLQMDSSGNLRVRGAVTTEEGGARFDFSGSSLFTTIAGTVTFTNGSPIITGSGTAFTELKNRLYIKKTSDANSLALSIESIDSDTQITLSANYAGTTGTTTADIADFLVNTGGGSISVANSLVSVASGTANGNNVYILKEGDYLPYSIRFNLSSISQRIANQTITIGLVDQWPNPNSGVYVQFTGVSASTVTFSSRSSSGAGDTQTTTVTRSTINTATAADFQIDVSNGQATLLINNIVVATHKTHLPDPYQILSFVAAITNSAVVTATTFTLDYVLLYNTNQVEVTSAFLGEPLKSSEDWRYQEYELPLAVGNTRVIVCPANVEWKIISISIVWTASSTSGNRLISARVEDIGNNTRSTIFISGTAHAANLVRNYEATRNGFQSTGFISTIFMFLNIGDQVIGNNRQIRIFDFASVSTTDSFSAILRVQERNT